MTKYDRAVARERVETAIDNLKNALTIRDRFQIALTDCIDAAPHDKQAALFDALKQYVSTRERYFATQPIAALFREGIEDGLMEIAIEREVNGA